MSKGWIKIDRQILDNWIYEAKVFDNLHAFLDLLLMAAFEEHTISTRHGIITLEPGQVFTSIPALAKRWGWSENRVRRYLGALTEVGSVCTDGSADGSVISVVNWAKFQGQRRADGSASGSADGSADGRVQKKERMVKRNKDSACARERVPAYINSSFRNFEERHTDYEALFGGEAWSG